MIRSLFGTAALAFLLGCSSEGGHCWERPGNPTTAEQRLDVPLDGIWLVVEDGVDVIWSMADSENSHMTWSAPEGLIDGAFAEWSADSLMIADANACRWLRNPEIHLTCSIFSPPPRGVVLNGSGIFETNDTLRRAADFTLRGNRSTSRARVALEADSVAVRIPAGALTVELAGRARRLGAYVAGLSALDASGLATSQAQIHSALNRSAAIRASDYAYVEIAGTGDVRVHGSPATLDVANAGMGGNLIEMP